ncbi:hypothetical protein PR202_ga10957 [Eleusine coracana subsp. coracana]|uniref:Uncharacterized protein n=1 Tax=Eleusine coracana subsp. coracana TaxID=191504 RepID=A0AAV5C7W9_ELECO|nr:hypothetical protein PR202_ga10957 [Eleusine coracana subsp. coracana]
MGERTKAGRRWFGAGALCAEQLRRIIEPLTQKLRHAAGREEEAFRSPKQRNAATTTRIISTVTDCKDHLGWPWNVAMSAILSSVVRTRELQAVA